MYVPEVIVGIVARSIETLPVGAETVIRLFEPVASAVTRYDGPVLALSNAACAVVFPVFAWA